MALIEPIPLPATAPPRSTRPTSEAKRPRPVPNPLYCGRHGDPDLITAGHLTGNLISDAHLAALAMEHGLTLCSNDSDFARFPDLAWTNPLR